MKLWPGIAWAAAVTPLLAMILQFGLPGRAAAQETWRVTNLEPSARIHLRESANQRGRVIAYIPADARGLAGGPCANGWCQVQYRGLTGWVFARYLTPDKPARSKSKPVVARAPERSQSFAVKKTLQLGKSGGTPIPVYAFPNEKLPVAGRLPADTATVEGLGSCIRDMCYVRQGELVGWLKTDALLAGDQAKVDEGATGALAQAAPADEGKALNKTVPTATQAPVRTAALLKELGDIDTKSYAIAGLTGQNALAVRENPDGTSRILAWIPSTATDVEGLRKCVGKWCLVRHGDASGWVARRHLADVAVESSQTFQVKDVDFWSKLDVLDYPNPNAQVVGKIPSYATGIVPIGGCDDEWCHIRYLGIAGWVNGAHLQPQIR